MVKDIFLKLMYDILESYMIFKMILPERIKIKKIEKLAANLHDIKEHVIHIRNLD